MTQPFNEFLWDLEVGLAAGSAPLIEIGLIREQALELIRRAKAYDKLMAFKEYVHGRFDKLDVPVDPYPEKNKEHGCRVEGRFDWLIAHTRQK